MAISKPNTEKEEWHWINAMIINNSCKFGHRIGMFGSALEMSYIWDEKRQMSNWEHLLDAIKLYFHCGFWKKGDE